MKFAASVLGLSILVLAIILGSIRYDLFFQGQILLLILAVSAGIYALKTADKKDIHKPVRFVGKNREKKQ